MRAYDTPHPAEKVLSTQLRAARVSRYVSGSNHMSSTATLSLPFNQISSTLTFPVIKLRCSFSHSHVAPSIVIRGESALIPLIEGLHQPAEKIESTVLTLLSILFKGFQLHLSLIGRLIFIYSSFSPNPLLCLARVSHSLFFPCN